MAICLRFELVKVIGTAAIYRFGVCTEKLDGLFEIDLYKLLIKKEIPDNTPLSQVVKLLNYRQSQSTANNIFSKIVKYYKHHLEYPEQGGYFA